MKKDRIPLKFFAPKFWGAWLGIFVLRIFAFIPYSWMKKISTALGRLFFNVAKTRRGIIETNIKLCFPDKTPKEQKELSKHAFISVIMAVFETSLAWWGDKNKIPQMHTVEGMEHLEAAAEKGKGVILLVSHFTTMEIAGAILNSHIDNLKVVYKPSQNALLEWIIQNKRLQRCCSGLIKHKKTRDMIRSVKKGNVVWYAPDQDFGYKDSIFAPFMGIMASTLLSTKRLAEITGAPVVPFYVARNANEQGYTMRFSPALVNLPSNDDFADASNINHAIERQVKQTPAQYLWAHRRFKTRPIGEPYLYNRRIRIWRYQLLLFVLYLPLMLYTLWQSMRHSEYRYFTQRLGFRYPQRNLNTNIKTSIWIHAASVGEVNATLPLILKIQNEQPDAQITLTSNTISSGKVAEKNLPNNVQHFYFPLDYSYAVNQVMSKINPDIIIVVETEIWPNLYRIAWNKNIPLVIINGRISDKTIASRKTWLGKIYTDILPLSSYVFARSDEDQTRFIRMGTPIDNIDVLGNIKFANIKSESSKAINLNRQYILAASTRDDEEQLIVDAWLKSNYDGKLLVIVPRHPQRLNTILSQLKSFNLEIAVRSKNETPGPSTDIYIADTIGELKGFIAGSDLVLMGGSFVEKGGHNILEVAQLGKAVVFGPDMRSFAVEAELFLQHNAGIQCSLEHLPETFNQLFKNTQELEENSKNLIQENQNIVNEYYQKIENIIKI